MMKRKVIGFLPGNNEVPATLRAIFVEFCLSLKISLGKSDDINDFSKNYATGEVKISPPRNNLTSSASLQNGILSTPFFLLYN